MSLFLFSLSQSWPQTPPPEVSHEDQAPDEDWYGRGVENYLRQNYPDAVRDLGRSINKGREVEKAKKLLLRTYQEWIQRASAGHQTDVLARLLHEAKTQFPDHPELTTMAFAASVRTAPASKNVTWRPAPKKVTEPPIKREEPKPLPAKPPSPKPVFSDWSWWPIIPALVGLMGATVAWYVQRQRRWLEKRFQESQSVLEDQLAALKDSLRRAEEDRTRRRLADEAGRWAQTARAARKPSAAEAALEKKKILESLVRISAEELPATQEAIALRVASLYRAGPDQALQFLRPLAMDDNPLVRMGVIPALARLATEPALDLILELAVAQDQGVRTQALKSLKEIRSSGERWKATAKNVQTKIMNFFEEERKKAEWII